MPFSHSPKRTVFPNSRTGKLLASLFVASIIVSSASVGLGLSRITITSPFGLDWEFITPIPIFIIPGVYIPTLIHYITIRYLLGEKERAGSIKINSPTKPRFRCLRRELNFWLLLFLAAIWSTGGILRLLVGVYNVLTSPYPTSYAIELTAAGLAVTEGIILTLIATFSLRLRQEAKVERAAVVPGNVTILDLESVSMLAANSAQEFDGAPSIGHASFGSAPPAYDQISTRG